MNLLDIRRHHNKQRKLDSLDRTLYGTRQTPEGGGRPFKVYTDLGGRVREVLGSPASYRSPSSGQMGGPRVVTLKVLNNSMFANVPLARFPPAPDLADLVNAALAIDEVYTIDDQR